MCSFKLLFINPRLSSNWFYYWFCLDLIDNGKLIWMDMSALYGSLEALTMPSSQLHVLLSWHNWLGFPPSPQKGHPQRWPAVHNYVTMKAEIRMCREPFNLVERQREGNRCWIMGALMQEIFVYYYPKSLLFLWGLLVSLFEERSSAPSEFVMHCMCQLDECHRYKNYKILSHQHLKRQRYTVMSIRFD